MRESRNLALDISFMSVICLYRVDQEKWRSVQRIETEMSDIG